MDSNTKAISIIIILIFAGIGIYYLVLPKPSFRQFETAALPQNGFSENSKVKGLEIKILKEGEGEVAQAGDILAVDYVGKLQDGTKFDSSIDRGAPFQFQLGSNSVIQGWELGVIGMKVGEKRELTIPPELAYGEQGAGDIIPPNATLIFEIDLLEILSIVGSL